MPNPTLDRLEQRIFANALILTAKDERVIDLLRRPLQTLRQPSDDVVGIVAK
jgi:hypothetical protein